MAAESTRRITGKPASLAVKGSQVRYHNRMSVRRATLLLRALSEINCHKLADNADSR